MNETPVVWSQVKKQAEAAIEAARTKLETPGMEPVVTEFHRGRIAAYREILSFEKGPAPKIKAPNFVQE